MSLLYIAIAVALAMLLLQVCVRIAAVLLEWDVGRRRRRHALRRRNARKGYIPIHDEGWKP